MRNLNTPSLAARSRKTGHLRDRWTPTIRLLSIASAWALVAGWAYFCVDLDRWLIVTGVFQPVPRGQERGGFTDIIYIVPVLVSGFGLLLAQLLALFLPVVTLLALNRQPLYLIVTVIGETLAIGFGTVVLAAFGGTWRIWAIVFVVQSVFTAYLAFLMIEHIRLRPALARYGAPPVSTQPN